MGNTCLRQVVTASSNRVVASSASASVLRGIELMTRHGLNDLVVQLDDGRFGVVTACDLLKSLRERDPADTTLGDIAHPLAGAVDADASVEETLVRMRETHDERVPVLDSLTFVGVVSLRDLLEYALYDVESEVMELSAYIGGPSVIPPSRTSSVPPIPRANPALK
jgi:CBS domain-containing protein